MRESFVYYMIVRFGNHRMIQLLELIDSLPLLLVVPNISCGSGKLFII